MLHTHSHKARCQTILAYLSCCSRGSEPARHTHNRSYIPIQAHNTRGVGGNWQWHAVQRLRLGELRLGRAIDHTATSAVTQDVSGRGSNTHTSRVKKTYVSILTNKAVAQTKPTTRYTTLRRLPMKESTRAESNETFWSDSTHVCMNTFHSVQWSK